MNFSQIKSYLSGSITYKITSRFHRCSTRVSLESFRHDDGYESKTTITTTTKTTKYCCRSWWTLWCLPFRPSSTCCSCASSSGSFSPFWASSCLVANSISVSTTTTNASITTWASHFLSSLWEIKKKRKVSNDNKHKLSESIHSNLSTGQNCRVELAAQIMLWIIWIEKKRMNLEPRMNEIGDIVWIVKDWEFIRWKKIRFTINLNVLEYEI